jgi:hypothetical protein
VAISKDAPDKSEDDEASESAKSPYQPLGLPPRPNYIEIEFDGTAREEEIIGEQTKEISALFLEMQRTRLMLGKLSKRLETEFHTRVQEILEQSDKQDRHCQRQ